MATTNAAGALPFSESKRYATTTEITTVHLIGRPPTIVVSANHFRPKPAATAPTYGTNVAVLNTKPARVRRLKAQA